MPAISTYLRPPSRASRWMTLLMGLLLAGWTVLAWRILAEHTAEQQVMRNIARVRERLAAAQPPPPPSKTAAEQSKRWADLKAERDFAWAPLFNALERSGNPDIELLEFHPDKMNASVVLRGEAKDEEALLDFVDRLSHSPALVHVYLSHRKLRKRDRLVTLSFEVRAALEHRARAGN